MKLFSFEQFVNESKKMNEALAVSNRGISDNILLVSINGTEYGYGEMKGGPDLEELSRKFSKMMTFSVGKALAWLKKNAELVKGSAKNESEDIEAVVGELVYEGLEEFEAEVANEGINVEYWANYHDYIVGHDNPKYHEKSKDFDTIWKIAVKSWNEDAADEENKLPSNQEPKIKKLAKEFFNKAKWISVNVCHAMISQEMV